VIKKPRERGDHSPRWGTEPEMMMMMMMIMMMINNNNNNTAYYVSGHKKLRENVVAKTGFRVINHLVTSVHRKPLHENIIRQT
jgi:hypothetical protein